MVAQYFIIILELFFNWYMNLGWQEMEMDKAIRLVCSSKGTYHEVLFQIL